MRKGSKYEATRDLGMVNIAKLIREDLKAATKAGDFPKGTKFSVRLDGSNTHSAVVVAITELPGIVLWENAGTDDSPKWVETKNGLPFVDKIRAVVWAYNFDASDSSVDYFHVRFYSHEYVCGQLLTRRKLILQAATGDQVAILGLMLEEAGCDNMPMLDRATEQSINQATAYLDAAQQGRAPNSKPVLLQKAWRTKAARKKGARYGVRFAETEGKVAA